MLLFGSLSYLSFLYHLSINLLPYQTLSFLISFVVQRLLVWCNPFLGVCGFFVVCLFAFVVFEILYKNMCGPTNMMKSLCYHLIVSQIWFLCLNFRSFLHRVRARGLVSLLSLQTDTQFSQHQSLKKPPFVAHKVCHLYTHKKSAISIRVGFICIPSIQFHWPMFMPVLYCFDFYSFVEYSEVSLSDDSSFVLPAQQCFSDSVPPVLSNKFQDVFPPLL